MVYRVIKRATASRGAARANTRPDDNDVRRGNRSRGAGKPSDQQEKTLWMTPAQVTVRPRRVHREECLRLTRYIRIGIIWLKLFLTYDLGFLDVTSEIFIFYEIFITEYFRKIGQRCGYKFYVSFQSTRYLCMPCLTLFLFLNIRWNIYYKVSF